jgi:hypothetical protein
MSSYYALLSFNSGELSPKIDNRLDMERYRAGCRRLENMIPTKYGGAEKRPGTAFLYDGTTSPNSLTTTTIRMIPFIYSSSVAYKIEVGHKYMRFFYGDAVLKNEDTEEVWITTPYTEDHIFELKFTQIADVMRITHPNYPPKLLSRTDVYTFALTDAPFRKGPFLTRNDLIDPDEPSDTTLSCNVTAQGAVGVLSANNNIFLPGHTGALFRLWHERTTKVATISGQTSTGVLRGKGTYNIVTRGTWTGTIVWQRKEAVGEWEELFSWKSSTDAYQNIVKSYVENEETNQHRLYSDDASSALRAELSIDEPLESGVVKVLAVLNSFEAAVEVYSELASTSATRRWAEGAWSESRGYPGAVTFFEDRCVYGGASRSLNDDEFSASEYPELRL